MYAGDGGAKRNCFSIWPLDNTVTSLLPPWDLFPAPLVKSQDEDGEEEEKRQKGRRTSPLPLFILLPPVAPKAATECSRCPGFSGFFVTVCVQIGTMATVSEPQTIKITVQKRVGGGG